MQTSFARIFSDLRNHTLHLDGAWPLGARPGPVTVTVRCWWSKTELQQKCVTVDWKVYYEQYQLREEGGVGDAAGKLEAANKPGWMTKQHG